MEQELKQFFNYTPKKSYYLDVEMIFQNLNQTNLMINKEVFKDMPIDLKGDFVFQKGTFVSETTRTMFYKRCQVLALFT